MPLYGSTRDPCEPPNKNKCARKTWTNTYGIYNGFAARTILTIVSALPTVVCGGTPVGRFFVRSWSTGFRRFQIRKTALCRRLFDAGRRHDRGKESLVLQFVCKCIASQVLFLLRHLFFSFRFRFGRFVIDRSVFFP